MGSEQRLVMGGGGASDDEAPIFATWELCGGSV